MSITKAQALHAFDGNGAALARFFRISQQAVSQWPDGPIPMRRQYELRERMPSAFPANEGAAEPLGVAVRHAVVELRVARGAR